MESEEKDILDYCKKTMGHYNYIVEKLQENARDRWVSEDGGTFDSISYGKGYAAAMKDVLEKYSPEFKSKTLTIEEFLKNV